MIDDGGPASGAAATVRARSRRAGRAVFGDRRGLAIFLGVLCAVGTYWRAGIFITDTATPVAVLGALVDGRLWIEPVSASHFSAPGAVVADGYVYGRNYGQVVFSIPLVWLLEGLGLVADLRVGLTALWHLALLGFVGQVAKLRGARRRVLLVGSALVFSSFALNLLLATQFVQPRIDLLALQLGSMLATGLLAVVTYRLVCRRHGTWLGVVAGVASVLVVPVGFWAGLPKRHVFVALLLVGILYAIDRSRADDVYVTVPAVGAVPGFRALAYALVGLIAWIHAGEGVFLFLALVVVDLPTAPDRDPRTLAALALVLSLSLAPAFLTNVLIAGNPLVPPRLLEPAKHVDPATVGETGAATDPRSVASTGYARIVDLSFLPGPLSYLASVVVGGLYGLTQVDQLYHTWIRSGPVGLIDGGRAAFTGANMTVLESVPVFGAFLAVIATGLRASIDRGRRVLARVEPVDAAALAFTAVFVVMYSLRLPVHVQITVRYLLSAYPLLLVVLLRSPVVSEPLLAHRRLVVWSYAAGVLVGTQLLFAVVVGLDQTVAGAVQTHAVVGLTLAAVLGVTLLASRLDSRLSPLGAVVLGLCGAAGTAFLLTAGLSYFSFVGEYVLPVFEALSDVVGRM